MVSVTPLSGWGVARPSVGKREPSFGGRARNCSISAWSPPPPIPMLDHRPAIPASNSPSVIGRTCGDALQLGIGRQLRVWDDPPRLSVPVQDEAAGGATLAAGRVVAERPHVLVRARRHSDQAVLTGARIRGSHHTPPTRPRLIRHAIATTLADAVARRPRGSRSSRLATWPSSTCCIGSAALVLRPGGRRSRSGYLSGRRRFCGRNLRR